jgi:hypothetical protein
MKKKNAAFPVEVSNQLTSLKECGYVSLCTPDLSTYTNILGI